MAIDLIRFKNPVNISCDQKCCISAGVQSNIASRHCRIRWTEIQNCSTVSQISNFFHNIMVRPVVWYVDVVYNSVLVSLCISKPWVCRYIVCAKFENTRQQTWKLLSASLMLTARYHHNHHHYKIRWNRVPRYLILNTCCWLLL